MTTYRQLTKEVWFIRINPSCSIYCAIFMVGPNALIDLVTYPLQKVLNQLASAYITDQRFSVSRFDKILPFNQNSKLLDNILRVNYYWVNF